jgi:AhpD family alkylhydroperoxidase
VRLDDDKIGRMGFWTRPADENRAIRNAEAENLSNDGAIWVTSPWKPSYLGYIGLLPQALTNPDKVRSRDIDEQTKELVAIGASVAANCYPCMKHHLAKCDELGVARAEVRAAAEVGKMVNRGAASNTRKFVDEVLGVEDSAVAD